MRWIALALIAGVGFFVWANVQWGSRAPGADGPSAPIDVSEAQVISYPYYGFEFHIPPQWRLEKYMEGGDVAQEGSIVIDRSQELSRFIELRHRQVADAELDLALTPNFDDDDLPALSFTEYSFGEGAYRVRYVASCEGEKLIYIEGSGRSVLVKPTEFCDTPAYKELDIDATFRAIAEGFRFVE